MVQFPLKFVINGTISIQLISRSLMAMSPDVPRMEYTYLNVFDSLEHLLTDFSWRTFYVFCIKNYIGTRGEDLSTVKVL